MNKCDFFGLERLGMLNYIIEKYKYELLITVRDILIEKNAYETFLFEFFQQNNYEVKTIYDVCFFYATLKI